MTLLPAPSDQAEYLALHSTEEPWLAAVRTICERHRLPASDLGRRLDGGNIVYRIGERVFLKLFAPMWAREHEVERAALERATGRLPVATPEIVASSEIEGWPYLLLARVEGQPAAECWATLGAADQRRIAAEIGQLAASLHAISISGLEALAVDWPRFMAQRRAVFVAEHLRRGAPARLVDGLKDMVARTWPISAERSVLLHADLADVNVLLAPGSHGWSVSGVIDFGDAFVGGSDYELVTPGEFLCCGRADLVRELLCGYGLAPAALDQHLAARLMALTALHRFGNVGRLATRVAARTGVSPEDLTLERLAEIAWSAA